MTPLCIPCVARILSGLLPPDNDADQDFYDILDIPQNSSQDDIDKAYSEQSLALHPDNKGRRGGGAASKEYGMVQEAHDVLANPRTRRTYHALGRNPTTYKFVSSEGYRNPSALCYNLSQASLGAKTRIVLLGTIVLLFITLQPLLIAAKILQTHQDKGGDLEHTKWTVILIPLWIMHGAFILLLVLLVHINAYKCEVLLQLLEHVCWISWEVLLAVRLDGTVDCNYVYVFVPFYLGIVLRIVKSLAIMQHSRRECKRLVSSKETEQDLIENGVSGCLLIKDKEANLRDESFLVHKDGRSDTDVFCDEEREVGVEIAQTNPECQHATERYYRAVSSLLTTVLLLAPLCSLLVLRLDQHIDASWWVVFIPLWVYLGWKVARATASFFWAMCGARQSRSKIEPPISFSTRSLSSGITSTTVASTFQQQKDSISGTMIGSLGEKAQQPSAFVSNSSLTNPPHSPMAAQGPAPSPPTPEEPVSLTSSPCQNDFTKPGTVKGSESISTVSAGSPKPTPGVHSFVQTPQRKQDLDIDSFGSPAAHAAMQMTPPLGVPSPAQEDTGEQEKRLATVVEPVSVGSVLLMSATQGLMTPIKTDIQELGTRGDSVDPSLACSAFPEVPPPGSISPIRTNNQAPHDNNNAVDGFSIGVTFPESPSPQSDGLAQETDDDEMGRMRIFESPQNFYQPRDNNRGNSGYVRVAPPDSFQQSGYYNEATFTSSRDISVISSAYVGSFDTIEIASIKPRENEAAIRAQQQLEDMRRMYIEGKAVAKPNTKAYNSVIAAWSQAGGEKGASEAEKLLSNMHKLHSDGDADVKPNAATYKAVIDAHLRSGQPGAAARADALLANMIQWYQSDPVQNLDLLPNAQIFNAVVSCWAKSNEHNAASNAEEMLLAMSHLHSLGLPDLKPNAGAYITVIEAWTRSEHRGAAERAYNLLDEMDAKYLAGDTDLKPNGFVYSAVIRALSRSGETGAASRAERVLRKMVNLHQMGLRNPATILRKMVKLQEAKDDIKPTTVDFNVVIEAWAKNGGGRKSAEHAEEIMEWMERLQKDENLSVKPDTETFNAVLDAWASSGDRMAPHRTEQILEHMDALHRNGNTSVEPNTDTYNTLLHAWAKSGEKGAAARAEHILSVMERRYRDGEGNVKPNIRSHTSIIDAWATSGEKGAAKRCEQILNNVQDLYISSGDPDIKPSVHAANAVFNACAFTKVEEDRSEALEIAFRLFDWLSSQQDIHPDSYTYTILLTICAKLLPRQDRAGRYAKAQELFGKCCQAGLVDDYVLMRLRQVVTEEEYMSFVEYENGPASSMPLEWTRNARV